MTSEVTTTNVFINRDTYNRFKQYCARNSLKITRECSDLLTLAIERRLEQDVKDSAGIELVVEEETSFILER